jgi:hypothetical protein
MLLTELPSINTRTGHKTARTYSVKAFIMSTFEEKVKAKMEAIKMAKEEEAIMKEALKRLNAEEKPWSEFVKQVWDEMRNTHGSMVTYKDAMHEASKRKRKDDL